MDGFYFDYTLVTQTVRFPGFSLEIESATNFEAIVDKMFQVHTDSGVFEESHAPYGAALWPAAVALGHSLFRYELRDKTVLELGAGTGLGSLVARKLGAHVLTTDYHPDMEHFCRRNAARNGLPLDYARLDWADPSFTRRFDVVIASDVLYDQNHAPLVMSVLKRTLRPDSLAIISDPQRGQLERLRGQLRDHGFSFTETAQHAEIQGQHANCIIFELRPPTM